jgi:hypothetical protein
MQPFTHGQVAEIRSMRAQGMRMAAICRYFDRHHTRDEIVEAIDAIHRFENNTDAKIRVNLVLALQASGVPLINGREAHRVATYSNRNRLPMF